MSESPRVLILKLAAMGDTVMASTLVGAVRDRRPDARITWLTAQALLPLVRRFAGVDEVLGVDADALLAGRGLQRVRAGLRTMWTLGRGPFDLALIAHGDARYARLLLGARVRATRALHGEYGPRPGMWHGAEYARLVDDVWSHGRAARAGASNAPPRLASLRWSEGAAPARARARHVLLAPGGARNVLRDNPLRRWPVAHWVALARQLHASGCRLTIIGAGSDAADAAPVLQAVPSAANAVGTDSLERLLARIAAADAIVTHDSGTLHLAQLTDTPAVALFGPTPPSSFVAPQARVTIVSAASGLACAPCYDGRDYAPCALNRCLTDVPAERVAAAVDDLLRAAD